MSLQDFEKSKRLQEEYAAGFKDGHECCQKIIEKYENPNKFMSLKDTFKTYLPWLNFTDLRIEEKNGKISFQGVCKRDQKG